MELCPSIHCCSLRSSHRTEYDSKDAEPSRPVKVPESQALTSLQPLPKVDSTDRPARQMSTRSTLEPESKDRPDTRRISSAIVAFNRPIDRPSDSSTRNFESIISLHQRDPNMAKEDRKLTLGGDQRYMTDPSRMKFSEDIANRNMLSTTSNVYPEPNPSAPRSLPLSVGSNKYSEDVANRVLSYPVSTTSSPAAISLPPSSDGDTRRISSPRDAPDDYYTARFKPTYDAYTLDSTHRNSAERKDANSSLPEDTQSHHSLAEKISRHNSLGNRENSLGGKESSRNSLSKAASGVTSGSSGAAPLSAEEMETKEVNRMASDNFYESRATHPRDRVRASDPASPVASRFDEQPGASSSQTLQIERPKFDRQISPMNQTEILKSVSQQPPLDSALDILKAIAATDSIATQSSIAESPDQPTRQQARTERRTPDQPTHDHPTELTLAPNHGTTPAARPSTPHPHAPDRPTPALNVPSSHPPASGASARAPATPSTHAAAAPMSPFCSNGAGGAAPRVRTGKTWPVRFDTASGGYEGLEEEVAARRARMVVGGMLARTDTGARAMPGGWCDGSGGARRA